MTTRDRAVNQRCPKGTWDKPIHPHLRRQIQMNTSACAHAKLCTYAPARMHTHTHTHTHTNYVVQGIYCHLLGDDTQLLRTRTVGWARPDSSQTVKQQVGAQGPFTTRGPFSRWLKKNIVWIFRDYLLGCNDYLNISFIILNRRFLSVFKLVLAQNLK